MMLKNTYYLLRHGQAVSNVIGVCSSWPEGFDNPLTDAGRVEAAAAAEALKDKSVDLVVTSDVLRAKETAEIIARTLDKEIESDERLREMDFGQLNGKPLRELRDYFKDEAERVSRPAPGGESYADVRARVLAFLEDMEKAHQGKRIVIVSHKCPLWILQSIAMGITLEEAIKTFPPIEKRFANGEIKLLTSNPQHAD